MAQFMQPLGNESKHHYYLAFGGRLTYSIMGNYKQSADKLEYWYIGNGSDGTYRRELLDYNPEKRSLKFAGFNVMASLETGFRWKLSDVVSLYTGLYVDYGILNLIPKGLERKLCEPNESEEVVVKVGSKAPIEGLTLNDFSTISILEADQSDIYSIGIGQGGQFNQVNDRYADKVNNLGAGLKIKLAFGFPKNGEKRAPKPKPEPKPKTKPEPKPAKEKVKEVPQEIKQAMMKLSHTLFAFDKWNLSNEAVVELDKVVKWLKDNPEINVEIEGHTDSMGSAEYNQRLSEERAKSVYDYFVTHGVKADRLSYRGYGLTRPVADNSTAEGRQLNRRAELKIVK